MCEKVLCGGGKVIFDSLISLGGKRSDGDDDEIEKIWKAAYSLKEFLKPSEFKTYDELKTKLTRVLGGGSDYKPRHKNVEEAGQEIDEVVADPTGASDDDALSYFNKLAAE